MSFPRTDVRRRTDKDFRQKIDTHHHKRDSPLLPLPINMVEDIIVCDMLHQLHVGIMKRQLLGFTGQIKNNKSVRWDCRRMGDINKFLSNCSMPSEINRAVRGLDCISFWKASEFRTFLLYLGPVILKDNINSEAYQNFLSFFCAITICSCYKYLIHLDAAHALLINYIEVFINIYGINSVVSNIHNLCHLTEEVSRFGPLPTFSTYPFESKLFQIKNLLRNGSKPLVQVARRMGEFNSLLVYKPNHNPRTYPFVTSPTKSISNLVPNGTFYKKVHLNKSTSLSSDNANRWFLTNDKNIVSMKYGVVIDDKIFILGNALKSKHNFFTSPMHSSSLNIYMSNGDINKDKLFSIDQINLKFVCVRYENDKVLQNVFFPLLHTV